MQLNRQRPTAAILAALVGLLVYLAGPSSARAYPQFQFSTDNSRCDLCHYAPAGGGLINGFGRDEASDTISSRSGQGGLLHGLWAPPKWFQLGGDFRGAGIVKKGTDGAELLGFPMQADLYARLAAGNFSFNTVVGLRGAAREPRRGPLGQLISREHFLMWQQSSSGTYARAGRFFPTYGLRLVDHTAYVRRYLGLHTLEETYNLGAGQIKDKWELHGTLFVPPPIFGVGAKATGGTLYYERRIREDTGAFGVQSRVAVAPDESRYWLGGVGKLWFSEQKLLFLSELNLGLQTFAGDAGPRMQMAGYLGATYFWRQGWMLGAALEHYDADLTLTGTAREAVGLSVQYFPLAHVELMLYGKYEVVGGFGESNPMAMLMLHYYL